MAVKRTLLNCLILIAIVGLSGCAAYYVPSVQAPDPTLIRDISRGKTISLINAQPSTEIILVGDCGLGRLVRANLHAWTDQVIVAMKETLQKKGVEVSERSPASLKIAITKATLEEAGAGFAFRSKIDFTIELSDGQVYSQTGEDHSWKCLNAFDGAMSDVALRALNNEPVVKFLAGR